MSQALFEILKEARAKKKRIAFESDYSKFFLHCMNTDGIN